jgi:hypothetical protein
VFSLLWNLSAALRGYCTPACLPTERWTGCKPHMASSGRSQLRCSPSRPTSARWSVCATIVERGGPAYLNLLVLLFAWNAIKFGATCVLTPVRWLALGLGRSARAKERIRAVRVLGSQVVIRLAPGSAPTTRWALCGYRGTGGASAPAPLDRHASVSLTIIK